MQTMRYFEGLRTYEELKKEYRRLARKLHPDFGGDAEEFKKMAAEYDEAVKNLNRTGETRKTAEGREYQYKETADPAEYRDIIDKMLHWNVNIEIIGSWLWVSGETYSHRKELKAMHFGFSGKKKAWYYHSEPFRKESSKRFSLDDLRNIYGSETVKEAAERRAEIA